MKAKCALTQFTDYLGSRQATWTISAVTRFEAEELDYESGICTRISEWVEIDFPDLPKDELVQGAVASLDKQKEDLVKEYTKKLHAVAVKKANLLSLPAPAAPIGGDDEIPF